MPDSGFFLDDSDARLIQSLIKRIEQLEAATAEKIAPATLVPYVAPVRSSKWSENHISAIGEFWTHQYQLNDINTNGIAIDRTENDAFNGILNAENVVAKPTQGQIGGLQSEGSYSYYFPGKEKSRVNLPLLTTKSKGFYTEVVFKPETLPQKSVIVYNGNYGTTGWGLAIDSGSGTAGEFICIRHAAFGIFSTGVKAIAGQWHCVQMWVSEAGVATVSVAQLNPDTKVITVSAYTGSPPINTPTTQAYIGSTDPTVTGNEFKGWIDEWNLYDGLPPLTEVVKSPYDRWRTALEASPPPGFVLPDGTAVSRAQFDRLFKAIGTIYGAGDGTTTFNLPDMKSRVPVQRNLGALGLTLGAETHSLTAPELPDHTHYLPFHISSWEVGGYGLAVGGGFTDRVPVGWGIDGTTTISYGIVGFGGVAAHNNMQPSLLTNYLLKT